MVVQPGELVAVIGEVGAGKSSLLAALLGELMPVKAADGTVHGGCAGRSPRHKRDGVSWQPRQHHGCWRGGITARSSALPILDSSVLTSPCVKSPPLLGTCCLMYSRLYHCRRQGVNVQPGAQKCATQPPNHSVSTPSRVFFMCRRQPHRCRQGVVLQPGALDHARLTE